MCIKDSHRFANIASGFQSLIVAIAVLVGGVWTLYTFDALRVRQKALVELESIKKKISEIGNLEANIEVRILSVHDEYPKSIEVSVIIKNTGNSDVKIDLGPKALAVATVKDSKNRIPILKNVVYTPISALIHHNSKMWTLPYTVISAGTTAKLSVWLEVNHSGIYLVSFKGVPDEKLQLSKKESGLKQGHRSTIAVRKYISL